MTVLPFERERPAAHGHQHQRLAGVLQCPQQARLAAGQAELRAGRGFAAVLLGLADAGDHHVGLARHVDGFRDHLLGRARIDGRGFAEHVEPRRHVAIVDDIGALGIKDFRLARRCAQALQQRDAFFRMRRHRPGALHIGAAVGQRPDHGNRARALERQRAVVLQQDACARRRCARQPPAVGGERDLLPAGFVEAAKGIVEQAEPLLGGQHAAAGGVDLMLGNAAFRHQFRQMLEIALAHQVDIDAGIEGEQRRFLAVGCHAMIHQLGDGGVVRHDQPVEAPLSAQQIAQQFAVCGAGDAGEIVEADHDGADARLDRRLERRQHHIVHAVGAQIDGVIVAPAFGEAVAGEMLGAGHHAVGQRQIGLLVTLDHGLGESRAQQRVFARAFGAAAPARVARDVEHRRPGERNAGGRRFARGNTRATAHEVHVEGTGERQRQRKDGAVAVDHVEGEDERNALRRLLDRDLLPTRQLLDAGARRQEADFGAADAAFDVGGGAAGAGGVAAAGREQVQLPHLFGEAHAAEQGVDEIGHRLPG